MKIRVDYPWSAWTAWTYPIAGLVALKYAPGPAALVCFLAMILLGMGTWEFHAHFTKAHMDLDHMGMTAIFFALSVLCIAGPGWWPLALVGMLAAIWQLSRSVNDIKLMEILVFFCFLGLAVRGRWVELAVSAGLLGAGFVAWNLGGGTGSNFKDGWHSIWHDLTATGIAALIWGSCHP